MIGPYGKVGTLVSRCSGYNCCRPMRW